ncbi:hypothetical protein OROHE_025909 [Orobanche hederae]
MLLTIFLHQLMCDGCLGALDGTYIQMQPEEVDKIKLVLEALSKMGTLTEENKLYFAYKIATDATIMNLFLNFSEGERITFVNMMMAGKI